VARDDRHEDAEEGRAHYLLRVARLRLGDSDRAVESFDRAWAHLRAARHQQAVEDCSRALELDPDLSAA
jgi:tetratricopeptide (TPR) repeat protein